MRVNILTLFRSLVTTPVVVASLVAVLGFALLPTEAVLAFNQGIQDGANSAQGKDQTDDLFGADGIFRTITNVLLFIIGAISVIMLIIGGIRYTISGGDSNNVTAAKNTILYAIVGIVVALLAYAVVNFVLTSFAE